MRLLDGFKIGEWTVYPLEGALRSADRVERIQPKSMDVLLSLADKAPRVVTRDELLHAVWGDRAVSDEPLTRCIGELRRSLGDIRSRPSYIATIPKRGYQLLKPVVKIVPESLEEETDPRKHTEPQRKLRRDTAKKIAIGAAVLVAAALAEVMIERLLDDPDIDYINDEQPAVEIIDAPHRSIAVLPFVNMSSDKEQEYFSDGVSEELLNLLAQIPGLRVISRTSAFSYKDKQIDLPTIAEQLNVAHVLEGSVRKVGNQVRITTQLIDARTDRHLWSEIYERTLDDIFATQDDIAARVAEQLKVSLSGVRPTTHVIKPEAYALVLQAKYFARQGNRESFEQAIAFFQEAISIDPEYAPAWAYLANVYANLAGQGHWEWEVGFNTAREAARRAVEIDPTYSMGHQQLAWISHRFDGDLVAAIAHMRNALRNDSLDVEILRNAAGLLLQIGKTDKTITVLEYCVSRSPLDPRGIFNLGVAYVYADRLADAERSFLKVLRLSPTYNGATYYLGETLLLTGRAEEALKVWQQLENFNLPKGKALATYALQRRDDSDEALSNLIEHWGEQVPGTVADVYAYRGEIDLAFEWLEKDYQKFGAAGWGELKQQRLIDNLRSDPRWLTFVERAGVTDEQLSALDFEVAIPKE